MKGLTTKDLISIGIFNAVGIVLYLAIGVITMPLPPVHFFGAQPLAAVVNGTVFLLLAAKVQKRGVFLISGLLQGFVFSAFLGLYATLLFGPVAGLLADRICGDFTSRRKMIVAYALFMLGVYYGQIFFFFFFTDWFLSFFQGTTLAHKQDFAHSMTGNLFVVMTIAILTAGFSGGFIGAKMLNKHFIKSGIVS